MSVCSIERCFVDSSDKLNCAVNHSSALWGINLGASAGPPLRSPPTLLHLANNSRMPQALPSGSTCNSFCCSCAFSGLLWREFPLKLKFEFAVGKCIRAEQSIHISWHKFLKGFAGALECLKCWLILDMLSLSLSHSLRLSVCVCVCAH